MLATMIAASSCGDDAIKELPAGTQPAVQPSAGGPPGTLPPTPGPAGPVAPLPAGDPAASTKICELYRSEMAFMQGFPSPEYQNPEQAEQWVGELGRLATEAPKIAPPEIKEQVDALAALYPPLHEAMEAAQYNWAKMLQDNPDFIAQLQAQRWDQLIAGLFDWFSKNCA